MSSNIDKALSEVIASRPKNKRRSFRRASAKAALIGSQAAAPAVPKVAAKAAKAAKVTAPSTAKIIVSNLPLDVNEAQVKELFSTQVGPTKSVTLNYDANGRSKGIASVVFTRAGDGTKAFEQYNGRLIDGKTPMKVEIVVDPSKPRQTLSQRVAPAPAAKTGAVPARKRTKNRVTKKKGTKRPPKTAEDLDAEMVDYTNQAGTTNATS